MDLRELILGGKKKRAKAHLSNLMKIAASDGSFDPIEASYLLSLAGRFNVTEAELRRIQEHPDAARSTPPTNDRERFDQLHQLVSMMLIDGEIHDQEMLVCKAYAERLELRSEFVDDFVRAIGESVDQEVPSDIIIAKLLTVAQEREAARVGEPMIS